MITAPCGIHLFGRRVDVCPICAAVHAEIAREPKAESKWSDPVSTKGGREKYKGPVDRKSGRPRRDAPAF